MNFCNVTKTHSRIDTIFYMIYVSLKDHREYINYFFFGFSIIPAIVPIGIPYFLFAISAKVILNADDIIDLIQNFACLFVILQFDDIMMSFLDFFPFRAFVDDVLKFKSSRGPSIYSILSDYPDELSNIIKRTEPIEFDYIQSICECQTFFMKKIAMQGISVLIKERRNY